MYDFHKAKENNNENCFWHPLFQRDLKHFLSGIKRKTAGTVAEPVELYQDSSKKPKTSGKDIQGLVITNFLIKYIVSKFTDKT